MKATGIYWLPETPADWEIAGAGLLFAESKKLAEHDAPVLTPSKEFGVITRDEYSELSGHRPNQNFATVDQMLAVEPGHFIITMGSFESGLEYSRISGKITSHYRVLEASDRCDHGYYRWLFKSAPFIDGLAGLATEIRKGQEINYTKFSRLSLPLPPLETQRRIAEYLDRETGKIDETITRLDRVVELLEERRSSVIRVLVQRDHDGNDFPTAPAGSLFELIGSGTTPKGDEFYSDEAGIPWVTTSGLREREIITTSKYVNDLALQSHSSLRVFPAGSLLIAMYGATIGRLGWLGVDAAMNQACCAFSEPRGIIPKFFFYSMLADREKLLLFASGGGQPNINQALLRRWRVPVPPLEIQEKAVEEITRETKEIDVMIEKSVKTRALLEEHRSALITAAVTGRIEVQ